MTLQDWAARRWIIPHKTSRQEIIDLLAVSDHDLEECRTPGLGPNWRLNIADMARERSPRPGLMLRGKARAIHALAAALCLLCAAGCGDQAGDTATPAAPAEGATAPGVETSGPLPLIEASGLAVGGDGTAAIIAGDETFDRVWGVSLSDFSKRWELPFPTGTPLLNDIEALAPWGKDGLWVACSQGRTKQRNKIKPERFRLALMTLSPDGRRITGARVFGNLRDPLLGFLLAEPRTIVENPVALTEAKPNEGGLNVEGLAAWKGRLLIGLRSPVAPGGGALVIPMRDPERIFSTGGRPDFGKIMVLPTGPGEGIRDMVAEDGTVLVLLGSQSDVGPGFRLVRWGPEKNTVTTLRAAGLKHVKKPEGIALDPQGRLLVVQDLRPPLEQKVIFRLDLKEPKEPKDPD